MTDPAIEGDQGAVDDLCRRFRDTASTAFRGVPLYMRLSTAIGNDPAVARLLLHAPPGQRLPVLLFACVHWMLISEPGHDLRRYYPNLVADADTTDPYPAFRNFCAHHEPRLAGLLATRSTQTNEIGRCSLLLPALGIVHQEVDTELALLDVGASAGLNLLLDRYEYRYDPGGTVGGPATVVLECGTRGPLPLPRSIPPITARLGLDLAPVDVADTAATNWLEACVWPDQIARFQRLSAALDVARSHPVEVREGDAVADLAAAICELAEHGHPVVITTWVLNYVTTDERRQFVAVLDEIGRDLDLSWIVAESPALTDGLPLEVSRTTAELTQLALVRWRGGHRTVDVLADAHPHGAWLQWHTPPAG